MRQVITTSQFAVYDDALSNDQHATASRLLQQEQYTPIALGMGVYRIDDGQALRCDKSYFWSEAPPGVLPARDKWKARLVPAVDTPYDPLLRAIACVAAKHEELLGREEQDWIGIILTPHLYKRGDAVSWHTDGFSYTGAFAYYAHTQWNCLWGGELLVVDEKTARDPSNYARTCILDNQRENERLMTPGHGRFIFPKPNRLVLIAGGNEHMISKVRDAAGNQVRAVFAGFFLKIDAANRTLC